jgi:DNA-binding NarL/FixJ family response regulator
MHQGQLSPRERDVARLVACGMTNAETARSLGLSASTVKHYVESAMRKAGVTNRVAPAMWLRDREGAG